MISSGLIGLSVLALGLMPPNYVESVQYPNAVSFVTDMQVMQGYQNMTPYEVEANGSVDDMPIGYAYVMTSARASYDVEGFHLESVSFNAFALGDDGLKGSRWLNSQTCLYPYAFVMYSPVSNIYIVDEYSGYAFANGFDDLDKFSRSGVSYSVAPNGFLKASTTYNTTTSGPYSISINDSAGFLQYLEAVAWPYFVRNGDYNQGYNYGYSDGYQDGKSTGHDVGYAEGYQDASDSLATSAVVTSNLFGGIVSIPISILNGLSVLTIWNVPVIGIIVTFLFIGLILWMIKRLI